MNDEPLSKSTAPAGDSMAVPDDDQSPTSPVFDISSDLGIKPEDASSDPADAGEKEILRKDQSSMQKMMQESLEKELAEPIIPIGANNPHEAVSPKPDIKPIPAPTPTPTTTPTPTPTRQSVQHIQYQENVNTSSVAANGPINLQEAIATIVPRNINQLTEGAKPIPPAAGGNPTIQTNTSPTNANHDPLNIVPGQNTSETFSQKFPNSPHIFIKPIRTYAGDVAEVLSHNNTSQASIAIAENVKKESSDMKALEKMGMKEIPKIKHRPEVIPIFDPKLAPSMSRGPKEVVPTPAPKVQESTPISANADFYKPATPPPPPVPTPPLPPPIPQPVHIEKKEIPIPPPLPKIAPEIQAPEKVKEVTEVFQEPRKKFPVKNIFIVLVSIILIGGGGVAAYYLYSISPIANITSPIKNTNKLKGLISADSQNYLAIDNMNSKTIFDRVTSEFAKNTKNDWITEIVLTEKQNGSTVKVGGPSMLQKFDITPPDTFVRSMTEDWMLGSYSDTTGQKSIFIITSTNFFQNAFAGMLSWEKVMPDDLKQYLPRELTLTTLYNPDGTAISSSSTPPVNVPTNQYAPIIGKFEDHIVRNKDVRTFVTSSGQTLFLYSFIDNDKMVWTTSETTLAEIVRRLEKQAFVR